MDIGQPQVLFTISPALNQEVLRELQKGPQPRLAPAEL